VADPAMRVVYDDERCAVLRIVGWAPADPIESDSEALPAAARP
jgi:hypothetical protein